MNRGVRCSGSFIPISKCLAGSFDESARSTIRSRAMVRTWCRARAGLVLCAVRGDVRTARLRRGSLRERPVRQRLDARQGHRRGCRAIGAQAFVPAGNAARGDGRDVCEHDRPRGTSRSGYLGIPSRRLGPRRVPPSTSRAFGLSIDDVPRIEWASISRTPNRRLHQTPVVGFAPAHGSPRGGAAVQIIETVVTDVTRLARRW